MLNAYLVRRTSEIPEKHKNIKSQTGKNVGKSTPSHP
jgi:hypothetical protein